jgi:uncharacterized protein (TIGR01777 family)
MTRVLVSGATGFIGRRVAAAFVVRGDEVTALTRDVESARRVLGDPIRLQQWSLSSPDLVIDTDAVVHLAGERAVGRRWTASAKREILESRVRSTELLVQAMRRSPRRPSVFVCASAVGYYGPHAADVIDERSPPGADFLAEVTKAWEEAAIGAEALGVRVVRARLGIVLGRGGGALEEMAKPFRMFAGGPIGSGKQYVSWVHRDDVARAFEFCVDRASIRGAVNVTSPHPVTNAEMSTVMGKVLRRPSALRVPEFALRLRFGEGADPIVAGQRVAPGVLANNGFSWSYPRIEDALSEALG